MIIVLAGGFIGVLADHLGRRIGKKKLSFRSMRPKHVARLGTFIAGTLVSLITIMLVYSTSSGIRDWITKGRAAIYLAKKLTAQNATLGADIRAKTSQIDQLDREAKLARSSLNEATAKLAAIKSDLSTANAHLAEARQRVAEGQVKLASTQALLRKNQALLQSSQADLASVQRNLKDARANYVALKASYSVLDKQRLEADEKVRSDHVVETALTAEIGSLKDETAKLTRELEHDTQLLGVAENDLHTTGLKLASKITQLEQANTDLERAKETTRKLYEIASGARSKPLTYGIGQEVARKRVGPHPSVRQAHDALIGLIRDASSVAQARGAVPRAGSDSSAFVQEQLSKTAGGGIEEAAAIEDEIVSRLTASDQDVVLVAIATENTFEGEAVPLEIVGYPNPVVYHRGDVLDTLAVGRKSAPSTVLTKFTDFMIQRVHTRAIKDGMIPAIGKENSLVDIAPTETFKLVELLANSDRPLQLQIVAKDDTRAADALQLDFRIK